MAKVKKGDLFSCDACGLVVTVDEACGCATSEIICCDEPMTKGKPKAAKKAAPKKTVKAKKAVPAKKAAPKKKAVAKKPAPRKKK